MPMEAVFALSAMTWPAGVARFRELGLPLSAFEHDDARTVAAALMGDKPLDVPSTPVRAALERIRPGESSIADAMLCLMPDCPAWAVSCVDRFALAFAARWLPDCLEWCAGRLRRGEPFAHVVADLDRLLTFARPALLAHDRRAAA